ncbi:MAG: hypothetical protein HKO60_03635 [Pseudomonadales bacterium]|nr:hypothetical protein [Pseudomonadales bacterium]
MYRLIVAVVSFVFAGACLAENSVPGAGFIDPTRPPGKTADAQRASKQHQLQSILYSTNSRRSLAIINGKSYAVGDRSPFGVIKSISRDGVSVGESGQRLVKLHRELNKQMVAGK